MTVVYPDKIPIYESQSKEWMGHPHVVTHIYIYAHLNRWNTLDSFHQMQQSPKSKSKWKRMQNFFDIKALGLLQLAMVTLGMLLNILSIATTQFQEISLKVSEVMQGLCSCELQACSLHKYLSCCTMLLIMMELLAKAKSPSWDIRSDVQCYFSHMEIKGPQNSQHNFDVYSMFSTSKREMPTNESKRR